jgi:hypothetical protein
MQFNVSYWKKQLFNLIWIHTFLCQTSFLSIVKAWQKFSSSFMHSNIDTSVNHYCPNFSKLLPNKSLSLFKSYITRLVVIFFFFLFFQNIFFECISTLKLAINILDWKNLNYVYPYSIQTKQFKMHLDFETSYKHSRLKKSKLHFSFQISSVHSAKTFV